MLALILGGVCTASLFAAALTLLLEVAEQRRWLAELDLAQRRLQARQDRLQRMVQRMVQERGWRDSGLLTQFDWRKPEG